MKSDPRPIPDDGEVDRLLARHYHDTSPEFEARWIDLKRELRRTPARFTRPFLGWGLAGWMGGLGVACAILLIVQFVWTPVASPPEITPQLAELFAMDAVLGRALPLLDEGNRTALLHLSASGRLPN